MNERSAILLARKQLNWWMTSHFDDAVCHIAWRKITIALAGLIRKRTKKAKEPSEQDRASAEVFFTTIVRAIEEDGGEILLSPAGRDEFLDIFAKAIARTKGVLAVTTG